MARDRLIDVDRRFSLTLEVLLSAVDEARALQVAASFIALLPEGDMWESYLEDIAQALLERSCPERAFGVDPAGLERLLAFLQAIPESERCASRIGRALVDLYGWLGEQEAVERLRTGIVSPVESDAAADGAGGKDVRDWSGNPPVRRARSGTIETGLGLMVPVVHLPVDGEPWTMAGTLRGLRLEVEADRPNDEDHILVDVAVFGTRSGARLFERPLRAARAMLSEMGWLSSPTLLGARIDFEAHRGVHTGASADLALGVLFVCGLLKAAGSRHEFAPRPDVSVTGLLTDDGQVLEVDEATLAAKVRAVFFSPARLLVLPESQRDLAVEMVDDLRRTYPGRRIDVVGATHLKDVFYDRRAVDERWISPARHVGRKIWRRRWRVLAAGATLAVILQLLYAYRPRDRNPASFDVRGNVIVVQNRLGEPLREIPLGTREFDGTSFWIRPIVFLDFDADGVNEYCWLDGDQRVAGKSTVSCGDVDTGERLWTDTLRIALDYPGQPEVTSPHFSSLDIEAGDFDGSGEPQVYVLARHVPYFPSAVLKYDARTGRRRAVYVHAGRLTVLEAFDIGSDGITELITGGSHQAQQEACLAVLDPRDMEGHGASDAPYVWRGQEAASEMMHVRFPRTHVGNLMRYANIPAVLAAFPRSDHVEVRIGDASLGALSHSLVVARQDILDTTGPGAMSGGALYDLRTVPLPASGEVVVHMTWEPRIDRVGTTTFWDHIERFFIDYGYLSAPLSESGWRTWSDRVKQWKDGAWQEVGAGTEQAAN